MTFEEWYYNYWQLGDRVRDVDMAKTAWQAAQINLRDSFALGALNSIDQTHKHLFTEDCIARLAYEIADAMLREREK